MPRASSPRTSSAPPRHASAIRAWKTPERVGPPDETTRGRDRRFSLLSKEQVAPGLERFEKQANYAALIGCGGVNGFISYFRFPSAAARAAAVQERNGLIANELFCAKGTELVINELFGYDNTIGFCKKLGFPIHRPTHVYSAATESRREELEKATRISAHAHHLPPADIFCEPIRGSPHEFECQPFTGGGSEIVKLTD